MNKFSKDTWVEMFTEIGVSEEKMKQWHVIFEAKAPQKHQEFLEWLQIEKEEIKSIRAFSKA